MTGGVQIFMKELEVFGVFGLFTKHFPIFRRNSLRRLKTRIEKIISLLQLR